MRNILICVAFLLTLPAFSQVDGKAVNFRSAVVEFSPFNSVFESSRIDYKSDFVSNFDKTESAMYLFSNLNGKIFTNLKRSIVIQDNSLLYTPPKMDLNICGYLPNAVSTNFEGRDIFLSHLIDRSIATFLSNHVFKKK